VVSTTVPEGRAPQQPKIKNSMRDHCRRLDIQKAIKVFLTKTKCMRVQPAAVVAHTVLDFWAAVALVFRNRGRNHVDTS